MIFMFWFYLVFAWHLFNNKHLLCFKLCDYLADDGVHLSFRANISLLLLFCISTLCFDETHMIWEISRDVSCFFVVLLDISCFICQHPLVPAQLLGYRWLIEAAISWWICCLRVCTEILWPHPNADTVVECQKKSDWRF